jgi:hypothetical protein
MHTDADTAPTVAEYEPVGQSVHWVSDVRPVTLLKVPAGHELHCCEAPFW